MEEYFSTWKKSFVFAGRASRSEYWTFVIFNLVIQLLGYLLDYIFKTRIEWLDMGLFITLLSLVLLPPTLAVSARRLHDIGQSALLLFLFLVPGVGAIILFILYCIPGVDNENKYGVNPYDIFAEE